MQYPSTARRIIHIDMDAFFASVEQRDHPELRGKPVAVGRDQARGVVAAASYEARVFGVRSAMPSVTARRQCPDLIFALPRFEVYRAVSAQIHEVFRRSTDLIEPLSLDEAYLDVTKACASGVTATEIAQAIRQGIKSETGLTASAGVSFNKFLAKLASDQDKPDGLTVITPRKGADFVASLPVARFNGVGPVTEAKMKKLGILTGADLREKSLTFLAEHFGSSAEHYHAISRGIDPRPVRPNRIRKSVGAENTFAEDLTDLDEAVARLAPIIAKVVKRCGEKDVAGRTVTLKIKFADFEQITRRMTLSAAIRDPATIMAVARELLVGEFPFRKGIRLLGVSMSGFEVRDSQDEAQLELF
ncbi:MAG: DNA polymerase IV [Sulfitobacter sp.]|uniref:DNA polymerase IV n=1 Tax=Alphaproteobacteria TaxID=28211 RepID=UPI00294368D4|nr:DNA polymerase IV [Sulfitobacter sp. LC.270.F.C4]WOI17274.1 DNA polymerase IV [Sulfitobacter sp. LC.270.F.C4]